MGIILAATQTQTMDASGASPMTWVVSGIVIAIFLLWASGLFHNTALRGILNYEGSYVSRRRSLMIGFPIDRLHRNTSRPVGLRECQQRGKPENLSEIAVAGKAVGDEKSSLLRRA